MKQMHLQIVQATEAAAIAASAYVGSGDKIAADSAATKAMRNHLNKMDFAARVVIGEGEKDGAPGLFKDELVGLQAKKLKGDKVKFYDLAIDPIDGTTQTAKGGYEAMSVIAVGEEGCLFPSKVYYMNKIAVGPKVAKQISLSITDPVKRIVQGVSLATGKDIITVCLLDRLRHEKLVAELRQCKCRIRFIQDCDVSGAIAAALPDTGIDLFVGIGGAPEGVIAAVAIKALGGDFQGMLADNKEYKPIDNTILGFPELAKGDVMFAATGVIQGSLLRGVRYTPHGVVTHSILMDSSDGTVRWFESHHGNLEQD